MTEVVPFLASAILGVASAVFGWMVGRRAEDLVSALDLKQPSAGQVGAHLTPGGVAKICAWAIDCAQAGIAFLAPPVAALLLIKDQTVWVSVSYVAVAVIGLFAFARLLFMRPDRYVKYTAAGFTAIGGVTVALNLLAAFVVSLAV